MSDMFIYLDVCIAWVIFSFMEFYSCNLYLVVDSIWDSKKTFNLIMEIRGTGSFLHFIRSNGLTGSSPEINAFVVCMEEYDRLCACDSPEYRESKYNQCRGLFESSISRGDGLKSIFLSKTNSIKISFYTDHNRLIRSFSR